MSDPNPTEWTAGLGELVRAHRLYCGISQRTMAARLAMGEKSLSDIEIERRDIPRGFLPSEEAVVSHFVRQVDEVIAQAEMMLRGSDEDVVYFPVSESAIDEWARSVIGRAAVTTGLIVPTITAVTSVK